MPLHDIYQAKIDRKMLGEKHTLKTPRPLKVKDHAPRKSNINRETALHGLGQNHDLL